MHNAESAKETSKTRNSSLFHQLYQRPSWEYSLNKLYHKRELFSECSFKSLDTPLHLIQSLQVSSKSRYKGGSIININWHPQGLFAVAVTSDFGVLFYDPRQKEIQPFHRIHNAHNNFVNIITFVDDNTFLTASDDTTINMWDHRTYKLIKTFHGHTSWVKNIEPLRSVHLKSLLSDTSNSNNTPFTYDNQDVSQDHSEINGNATLDHIRNENPKNLFMTAAFDGTIRLWDLHRDYPQVQNSDNIIFTDPTLIRIKLSPSSNTLAISLTDGLLFLIHDVDFSSLFQDMSLQIRMQRDLYHLALYDHYRDGKDLVKLPSCMTRKKNRIEIAAKPLIGCTSLQFDNPGNFLLTRNNHPITSRETLTLFDMKHESEIPNNVWRRMVGEIDEMARDSEHVVTVQVTDENKAKIFPSRVKFHIGDPSDVPGYIKEVCLSPCGKYAVSPYHMGIRIFDTQLPKAEDLHIDPIKCLINTHTSGVLTVSHHPFWPIMASGDFGGMINFYSPEL